MNSRIFAGIFFLLIVHNISLCAQDFDADSIYYTPIPKVKPGEQTKRGGSDPQYIDQTGNPQPFAGGLSRRDTLTSDKFIEYFFNVQVGPLIGCDDCASNKEVSFTTSTVHGITIGEKFRVGGGLGFDSYYYWQTLPIFASTSWDLLGTKNTNALFIQFNYGWSSPWRTDQALEYGQTSVHGGQMFYGMAGLRLKYYDLRLGVTIGGKVQQVSTSLDTPFFYYDIYGNLIQGRSTTTTIKETMSRFAVGITIGWK